MASNSTLKDGLLIDDQLNSQVSINEMYSKRDLLMKQMKDVIPGTETYNGMESLIGDYNKSIQLKETAMSGPIGMMLADADSPWTIDRSYPNDLSKSKPIPERKYAFFQPNINNHKRDNAIARTSSMIEI